MLSTIEYSFDHVLLLFLFKLDTIALKLSIILSILKSCLNNLYDTDTPINLSPFSLFQSLPFPAVTLCNFNAIRYSALLDSNFTDLIDTIKKQSKHDCTIVFQEVGQKTKDKRQIRVYFDRIQTHDFLDTAWATSLLFITQLLIQAVYRTRAMYE